MRKPRYVITAGFDRFLVDYIPGDMWTTDRSQAQTFTARQAQIIVDMIYHSDFSRAVSLDLHVIAKEVNYAQ